MMPSVNGYNDKRLIEDYLPIIAFGEAASSEPRTKGHISTLHVWRARRPLVGQGADAVARDERRVRDHIKEMLEARLAGHRTAIVWPEKPDGVPDKDASFLVAYLPIEIGAKPKSAQEVQAKEILEKYGDKPRQYRNGLGLAVQSGD